MSRIKFLVVLVAVFADTFHADSDPQSPRASQDYELDYSEPGALTENCLCVPFYQCVDGEIVDDGSNILDPRRKPQEEELPIDDIYEPPECGPYHVCCRNPETSTSKPYEHRCGIRNPGGINGRILSSTGKGEAKFGEWPWQALVLLKEGSNFLFKCGGTLIDDQHILTVAHCVDKFLDKKANVVVRLGEWDTQNTEEFLPHEDFEVAQIIIHPEYRSNNLFNDIAILKLKTKVVFKPHIDTACLPKDNDNFTGQQCVVTGWGTDAYKSGSFPMIMKEVTLPVLGHNDCQNKLRKTRLGRYFKLHGGFLCAGGNEGEDSCKGDGGGPLVCYRSDYTYTLAGLVSWGIDCGHKDVPGVYVNVRKYINWISSNTGKPMPQYWSSE
ncbi:phenoloxidase-activating factor 2-like [Uloborus diversus]|uniref:phenoloxidase-activating factor 2-like n=1 Tax=Uloborus diversus TaxID=327109 RepID=UPI00240A3ABB|nr:phenoloxidase-activating factor 2-like [Uloborus diversus]